MKQKKAFTLVELLAVIAILAVILIIAVPTILGVIEDSRMKSFRLSVLSTFEGVKLEYAKTGITGGNLPDLPMNNNPFKSGEWNMDEGTGTITISQICDGNYKVGSLTNKSGDDFAVDKDNGKCEFDIIFNGNNPDNVSCSKTGTYEDQGAMYGSTKLTTTDTVDLSKAGTYQLHYKHQNSSATRIVNVSNTNQPTLNIKETEVTITKGDTFDANSYIESASDPCEGDITEKVQSVSEVLTDIGGIYTVTYKVKNLGNVETTKTMTVTVFDLAAPDPEVPEVPSETGWYDDEPIITLPENPTIEGYEYAISIDGGTTWGEYNPVEGNQITIDQEGNNIYLKIRGKRKDKYTDPVIKGPFKVDLLAPTCVSSGGNTAWVTSLTITGTCSDTVSGCVNETVTKAFTTYTDTTTASPGSVSDNAGHTTVCPADQTVKVDVSTPSAPTVSGGTSTTWTTENREFTLTAPSSSSGIASYEYYVSNSTTVPSASQTATGTGTTVSQSGQYVFFRAVNSAGTKGAWTAAKDLYVDKTTPGAPTVSGASTTWTSGNRTFTVSTAPSSTSGIKNYEYYVSGSNTAPAASQAATRTGLTVSATGKFVFFRAVNNAGTKGAWTAAQNNYVDKSTPGAPTVSGASTTWTSGNRTFTVSTAPSSTSGIKNYEYYVSGSNTAPAASQAATGTGLAVSATGKFVFFRAVNNAGTKGAWTAAQNSYVDKATPAAPTIAGGATTWTNGNRTFTATAPSSTSGIKNYEYYVSNANTTPAASQAATGTGLTISNSAKFVFFRAVNNARTKGAWTAYKNNYVDKTSPALAAKAASNTITQGTSAAPMNYFNITTNYNTTLSGGTTTCKVGSTTVTNVSSLAVGTHTLTCTMTTGAGTSKSASTTMVVNSNKYVACRNIYSDFGDGWYDGKPCTKRWDDWTEGTSLCYSEEACTSKSCNTYYKLGYQKKECDKAADGTLTNCVTTSYDNPSTSGACY